MGVLTIGNLSAQTFPVQVNVFAQPPHSAALSDWHSTTRERIVITLLNRDMMQPQLEVRLRISIEAGTGLRLNTREERFLPTFFLSPMLPERLTQTDIAPYFMPQNLSPGGGYFNQNNPRLPEGMVTVTITAIEAHTNRVLSAPASTNFILRSHRVPILRLPDNNENIAMQQGNVNILFQWEAQDRPAVPIEYEFELRQIPRHSLTPQSSFHYSPIIHQERTSMNLLRYNSMLMFPLEPDRTYAWRVRAIAQDGFDELSLFQNNGFSEIRWFSTQQNCPAPHGITYQVDNRTLTINWLPDFEHTEFIVQHRIKHGTPAESEWQEIRTQANSVEINNLRRGETYEFRVGGICGMAGAGTAGTATAAIFSNLHEAAIPEISEEVLARCGVAPVVDLSNQEPLQELNVGDILIIGGDFPMTVTRVTGGGNGRFSGEGWIMFGWIFESRLAIEFENLQINTDRRQIGGTARAVYDRDNAQILDLDRITEGGGNNTSMGITQTDVTLTFALPDDPVFTFDPETGTLKTFDLSGNQQQIQIPTNEAGEPIFPITVTDSNGNIYKITEEKDADGNPTGNLNVNHLGQQGTPFAPGSFDRNQITTDAVRITFANHENSRFAFDHVPEKFLRSSRLLTFYPTINPNNQRIPWKLLIEGETDLVVAKVDVRNQNFEARNIVFATPQGTRFNAEFDEQRQEFTITLPSGESRDIQEVFALYPRQFNPGQYHTLGRLNVVTYRWQTPRLMLVNINNNDIDKASVKAELDRVYLPVGINWQIEQMRFHTIMPESFFDEESRMFQRYNDAMLRLQEDFRSGRNIDRTTSYVFILGESGAGNDRDVLGFMPRGRQFGYVFTESIRRTSHCAYNIIAHELGHGRFRLRHTFDNLYGPTMEASRGQTDNLMDYAGGRHLARFQWSMISDPALLTTPFEDDEDAMRFIERISHSINIPPDFEYAFLLPTGKAVFIPSITRASFNWHGHLVRFTANGESYAALYSRDGNTDRFWGHVNTRDANQFTGVRTTTLTQRLERERFRNYRPAPVGSMIFAFARTFVTTHREYMYIDCVCEYRWTYSTFIANDTGRSQERILPTYARENCFGTECTVNNDLLIDGFGVKIYRALQPSAYERGYANELLALANHLSERINDVRDFTFFAVELTHTRAVSDQIRFFRDREIYSIRRFYEVFPHEFDASCTELIFSTVNLWEGIDRNAYNRYTRDWVVYRNHNEIRRYEYDLSDLVLRHNLMEINSNSVLARAIRRYEALGRATPITSANHTRQYAALFGTHSAVFAWANYVAYVSEDVLKAYMAYRLLPAAVGPTMVARQTALAATRTYFANEVRKNFLMGAAMEAIMYIIIEGLRDDQTNWFDFNWFDFTTSVTIAGFRNSFELGRSLQGWAGCLQGINLDNLSGFISNIEQMAFRGNINDDLIEEFISNVASLGTQCIIPLVFERFLRVQPNSQFRYAVQRSSEASLARFFSRLNLTEDIVREVFTYITELAVGISVEDLIKRIFGNNED